MDCQILSDVRVWDTSLEYINTCMYKSLGMNTRITQIIENPLKVGHWKE